MSGYRHALTELFKRGESGFNEEEQVNHIVYQLVDRYNLKTVAVLFFTGNADAYEVFAHRGLSRNFVKTLCSSSMKGIVRVAKKGEVVVVSGGPDEPPHVPSVCRDQEYPENEPGLRAHKGG